MIEFSESRDPGAKIVVVGVGGGGGNAVNTMVAARVEGVEFIAANTDTQALAANRAPLKLQLGKSASRGLGAGAKPEVGREAALEQKEAVAEALVGADMVFVTAGMGGGTGTGGAPIIADLARQAGALTVGVVTRPFLFEGNKRRKQAEAGIAEMRQAVDTLIVIPNQRLLSVAGENMAIADAFRRADEVLLNAVQGISDLITVHGFINVDFADVRTIMAEQGMALMGTGRASGARRAVEAMQAAVNSPLLEDVQIDGATGLLVNITGGPSLTLHEVNEAVTLAQSAADGDANIIFGSVIDERMGDEVKITVIATGFQGKEVRAAPARQATLPAMAPPRPAAAAPPAPVEVVREVARVATTRIAPPAPALPPPLRRPATRRAEAVPFQPADEDQYDIPTFLRKGGHGTHEP